MEVVRDIGAFFRMVSSGEYSKKSTNKVWTPLPDIKATMEATGYPQGYCKSMPDPYADIENLIIQHPDDENYKKQVVELKSYGIRQSVLNLTNALTRNLAEFNNLKTVAMKHVKNLDYDDVNKLLHTATALEKLRQLKGKIDWMETKKEEYFNVFKEFAEEYDPEKVPLNNENGNTSVVDKNETSVLYQKENNATD
jgi:hypothetical protein